MRNKIVSSIIRGAGIIMILLAFVVPPQFDGKADSQTVYSFYAHLQSVNVEVGQWVNQGDVIGWTGTTGYCLSCTAYPHVHWGFTLYPPEIAENQFDAYPNWGFLDPNEMVAQYGFIEPVPNSYDFGACFGCYNAGGKQAHHNAVDVANLIGAPVYASGSGYVIWNSKWPTYSNVNTTGHGITVFIQHDISTIGFRQHNVPNIVVPTPEYIAEGSIFLSGILPQDQSLTTPDAREINENASSPNESPPEETEGLRVEVVNGVTVDGFVLVLVVSALVLLVYFLFKH